MELLLERDKLLQHNDPGQPSLARSSNPGNIAAPRPNLNDINATRADPSTATSSQAARILSQPLIVLDGGLGTTLESQFDLTFTAAQTPTWSSHLLVAEPETLLAAQTSFSRQGAEIILTATYQASYEGFARTPRLATVTGDDDDDVNDITAPVGKDGTTSSGYSRVEAAEFMRSAIRISKFAIGSRAGVIALSLGPYGATIMPSAEYTAKYTYTDDMRGHSEEEKLFQWHFTRIRPYAELWSEFDLIAWETVPKLDEVLATRRVMDRIPSRKRYWITVVVTSEDKTGGASDSTNTSDPKQAPVYRMPDGTATSTLLPHLLQGTNPPWAIGINCTSIAKTRAVVRQWEEVAASSQSLELPRLVIYPDNAAGKKYDGVTQTWVQGTEDDVDDDDDANDLPGQLDTLKLMDSPVTKVKTQGKLEWDVRVARLVREVQDRKNWRGVVVGGCCKVTPKMIGKLKAELQSQKQR